MKKGHLPSLSLSTKRPAPKRRFLSMVRDFPKFVSDRIKIKLRKYWQNFQKSTFSNSLENNCCDSDYQAWQKRFLMKRLHLVLWIGVVFIASMFALFLSTAFLDPKLFKASYIFSCIPVEFGLLTCLVLQRTRIGRQYPALLFLGFCWSLTVVVQTWVAFYGSTKLLIPLWTMVFLTQATLIPVRWRLHLVSQISAFACYFGVNIALGLTIEEPVAYAIGYFFLFWVWFICDLSVYLYERLHRAEFNARKELECAYQKLTVAEAKYRSIFENAGEGIFQSTPEGHYITSNPALAKIYGYDRPEEVTTYFTDIEHQLYVEPKRRSEFIRLMRENGSVSNFESQIYRKDGSIVWISENAREVRDEDGNLLYYEGLIEDITKRKRAEESLRLFFHAVSHDLRNPVMGMLMLLKNWEDRSQAEISISRSVLQRMIHSSEHQLQLINSILETHAWEVQGVVCNCEPLLLSQLIKEVVEEFEPLYNQNKATLMNLTVDDSAIVNADNFQLRRVFENLIGNALKHNPIGLDLTINTAIEDNNTIKCTLQDNGIGMSQEQCDRLFELYFRGSNSRHSPGLGLGLYLCKQIIAAHNGQIGVISKPGEGSTFWFTLPLTSK